MTQKTKFAGVMRGSIEYLPVLLFVLTLLGTAGAAFYAHQKAQLEHRTRFESIKETITEALKGRFNFYENTLKQTGAYFMHGQTISSEEFKIYVHNIGLIRRYPGMTAIGYAEYVPAGKLQEFIQNRRKEGHEEYVVWPLEEGRSFYTPVKFIEPFFSLIRELRGFDMVNSPQRRSAMVKSAVDGKPTVTEEVDLFVEEAGSPPYGFNIFIPVYNAQTAPPTSEERIKKTQGYVFGVFSGEHLFNIIMKENLLFQKQAGIEVFLSSENGQMTKVYDSDVLYPSEESESSFQDEVRLSMGNKEWIFRIRSLEAFESQFSNNTRWIVLAFGSLLAISFLIFTHHIQKVNRKLEISNLEHEQLAISNSLLFNAGKTLGSTLDTATMLKRFAHFFVENFCDCCFIHVINAETLQLEQGVTASKEGETSECTKTLAAFTDSSHIANYVIKEKKTLFQKTSNTLGEKSFVSVPLMVKGQAFGVVNLLYNREKDLTPSEVSLLEQTVTVAATSIENSLLFKEAQMANRLKDEFLATVSHELRTPIMVTLGYSQLLLKKKLDPDVKKAVINISRAAENQGALIEDLLDVSAIISGKVKFRPQAVSLPEVIQAAIENVLLTAQSKKISIEFKAHEDCKVLGEKVRLQQIVLNLLSNSIKFTPEGGKISVNYIIDSNLCKISIQDNGKGIDSKFLPFVFDKFRQEEKTSTRTRGGLGLGLSIVSSLVELHGGSINVFSEGKGKGTTFTVTLPIMDSQNSIVVDQDPKVENSLQNVHILVVDNDSATLDLISRILQGYDAVMFTSNNIDDALRIISEESINIVISELTMPGKDGIDFVHEVRSKEKETGTHLPMLVLSAISQEETRKEAINNGFDFFLAKPVGPEELVGAVKNLILH